jgi:hypothetical protein
VVTGYGVSAAALCVEKTAKEESAVAQRQRQLVRSCSVCF